MFNYPTFIPAEIFRAYDIRGIADTHLTSEVIWAISLAISAELIAKNENTIVIGRDARISSQRISEVLALGLVSNGIKVIDVGEVPTPILYYATHNLKVASGVMITGSHNVAAYNGLKIILASETLAGEQIQALHRRIVKQDFADIPASLFNPSTREVQEGIGYLCSANQAQEDGVRRAIAQSKYPVPSATEDANYQQVNMLEPYIAAITSQIILKRPLKIVIDCGNGIAGILAPLLFRQLGCEVIELFCEVDGTFPNHHPDPSIAENLQELITAVKTHHADIGIAFDGDADRLGVVTAEGEIIAADRLLMLYAQQVLTHYPQTSIVYDVKCTGQMAPWLQKHQGIAVMCQTGHSWVKKKMREVNSLLAGEMSGHIFFKDRWYGFDDGLYAACRLVELVSAEHKSLTQWMSAIPQSINTPEIKVKVTEIEKFEIIASLQERGEFSSAQLIVIDGIRAEYEDGWGLIRASNTSPYLILRFEAVTLQALQRIQKVFQQQLQKVASHLDIAF